MTKRICGWTTLLALLLVGGCGDDGERVGDEGVTRGIEAVELVEGEGEPAPDPAPRLRILSPEAGERVPEGPVEVQISVSDFEPGAPTPGAEERGLAVDPGGQHVVLVVDNQEARPVHDLDEPVVLEGLSSGPHVLRAFLATPWHESVKSREAFALREFSVDEASEPMLDPRHPLITYSRPVGSYEGPEADSVLVDFFLTNVDLSPEGHRVRVTVDDLRRFEITEWKPHYLVGLPEGEWTVRIELLNSRGELVPRPFTRTERVIRVAR